MVRELRNKTKLQLSSVEVELWLSLARIISKLARDDVGRKQRKRRPCNYLGTEVNNK